MNLLFFTCLIMAVLKPQPGPQEQFLASPADIVIYGGAAGGGKSYGLLLEGGRHKDNPNFNGMIFRRIGKQITTGGGLWDTSMKIYPLLGSNSNESNHKTTFPSGAYIQFSHLEHEKNRYDHQGGQYPFIGFDELTHFTEKQFWYLYSRNRPATGCSVKPYIRCTTNPTHRDDPVGGWVRDLIDWWIGEDGFPIQERAGILRYFCRLDDSIIWVEEGWIDPATGKPAKSMTFIPAKLQDNRILMYQDPGYETTLNSLSRIDRMRLLYGNWDVSEKGGMFERSWFGCVDEAPQGIEWLRYWDRAATEPTPKNENPDWTAGALCGIHNGTLYIRDMKHFQKSPAGNEETIKETADCDGYDVTIGLEQEPGSSGADVAYNYQTRVLAGYTVLLDRPTGDKIDRAKPWCAWAENGNVKLVRGKWNENFIKEAINFPNGKKDQIDSVSGAYKYLTHTYRYTSMKGRI